MADEASNMVAKPWIAEGKAVVYGQSSFDPVQFMQTAAASQQARQEAQAKKAIARQAEWKDFKWDQYQPKEIYQENRDQINQELDKFSSIMSEAFNNGLSPNDPSVKGVTEQIRLRMLELENEGKLFNDRYNAVITQAQKDPSKYDPESIKAWQEEIKKLPTIQEKRAYVDNNNPLEEVFDIKSELLEVEFPTLLERERQSNPNFFTETKGLDEPKVKSMVKELLLSPKYSAQLAKEANKRVTDGTSKDYDTAVDELIKEYQDFIMNTGSTERKESGTPRQSTVINLGGGAKQFENAQVAPTRSDFVEGLSPNQKLYQPANNADNSIQLLGKQEGTFRPVQLFNSQGKVEEYVPLDLVVIEEGAKKFFAIRAQRATKTTARKIKEDQTEQDFLNELRQKAKGSEVEITDNGNGEYTVTYITPDTVLIPYNSVNKQRLGANVSKYADDWFMKNVGAGRFN